MNIISTAIDKNICDHLTSERAEAFPKSVTALSPLILGRVERLN